MLRPISALMTVSDLVPIECLTRQLNSIAYANDLGAILVIMFKIKLSTMNLHRFPKSLTNVLYKNKFTSKEGKVQKRQER